MNKDRDSKFPKSVSGEQCLGPCYESGSVIAHPMTLQEVSYNKNFCPTAPHVKIDPVTGQRKLDIIDNCYIPTVSQKDASNMSEDVQHQLIAPVFRFSANYFLRIYYNIGSFEETVDWLGKNHDAPYRTKERVFNQSMLLYGDSFSIVDHRLVEYTQYVMNYNMPVIFREVMNYIDVQDGQIKLVLPNNKTEYKKENVQPIIKYIESKFLGTSDIGKFLSKFLRYNFKDLKSPNFTDLLVSRMIEYIRGRVTATIES